MSLFTNRGSLVSLLGVLLISIFAYFGFSALFSAIDQDIKAEALIAAFGALFVLLPTKFLMEQESESRVKGDKRSAVFQANLEDYKKFATEMISVLKDRNITNEELLSLKQRHAFLVLLGSNNAVKCSREFIVKCQAYVERGQNENDSLEGVDLDDEQLEELWGMALNYILAAREGLQLPFDDLDSSDEIRAFTELTAKQNDIEERWGVRKELAGGLPEFCKIHNISGVREKRLLGFIQTLEGTNSDIRLKCAKHQISVRLDGYSNKNVLYIGRINKNSVIPLSFPATKTDAFYQTVKNELGGFNAQNQPQRGGAQYSLSMKIDKDIDLKTFAYSLNELLIKYVELEHQ